ncbi:FAD-dependent oxidoreductase [Holdemania massiliensis]|uniref:Urocanate reductase n=1 Tax=Holdemania massiliensis TaxID=1468449 RepID=A0A6N7SBX4_9FIRM|nr:FAD-dependent oxidoreductase [Holdemania massiliensis]MSA73236.1 FAD-dependent oxidoreductase [Holdemania massiliensis]MSA91423.1 FAD-dependent oxidoreductase [Holdemania massiliensis]MSB80300.1 FAD-dependent oxidoreductase [Holdemania massiliensis]MSC35221.1 FAD-dependent oxidoreductase [Holdemania massiliensis]MSC41610.1 FAD-dependent oxidoreductase [Holdemania massiliensis]
MKKLVSFILVSLLAATCVTGCSSAPAPSAAPESNTAYKAGTYTSTQTGMGGPIEVKTTFSDAAIESIEVGDNNETLMVGTEAIRILSEKIVANQLLGVDTVSGATYSSLALINGVKDCAQQAGADIEVLQAVEEETYADQTHEAEILIVGGGLSGITAALSAAQNGAQVILLEQKEYLGGNSVLSTGDFLLGGTSLQAAQGIEDNAEDFYQWQIDDSEGKKDPNQCRMIADNGQTLIDWFESMGVHYNTAKIDKTDGSEVARGHAVSPNIATAVSTLIGAMEKAGVDIRYQTRIDTLLVDDNGHVNGVSGTDAAGNRVEYTGENIVLASGGWGDNNEMIVKYWGEDYDGLVYGGSKGMDGAMLNAALELGAGLIDMDDKHVDATLEVNKHITVTTNIVRNCGGILIRQSTGQRFCDEQASHSEVASKVMHELGDPYYYEIFDSHAVDYNESVAYKINSYENMGLMEEYDSIEAMAKALEVDEAVLKETIDKVNATVRGETEDEFGRERFFQELEAPYYVMKVANGVACTTGGLRVNDLLQVVKEDGTPVSDNLYAIGEIAGGYLVKYIGGSSLSHSAIGGMVLGKQLAAQ